MLSAAVQTANSFCLNSDHCVKRLGELEEEIEDAAAIGGIRVLRFRLTECLQRLREEALHQRKQMTEVLEQLREQLEIAQGAKSAAASLSPSADALSGLEARAGAEHAFADAMARKAPAYAVLFVADHLHLINARYGYSTGDHMLRGLCEHLASRLSPGDRLFRWTGPVFVVLMERVESVAAIREEISRITSVKLEVTVQIGNGSISLPVPCTSLLLPLPEASGLADLTKRMDAFIAEQARH